MKYTKTLLIGFAGALVANCSFAANTSILWGVRLSPPTFLVGDSSNSAYDSVGNPSLVALGYFEDGFDVVANQNDLGSIFDNFNLLDTANVNTGLFAGTFEGSVEVEVDSSGIAGETPFYWVLPGVSTFDRASIVLAPEHAVLGDTAWTIPSGASPIPTEYDIRQTSLNNIVIGNTVVGAGAFGGDLYTTVAAVGAIPEPSTYAAIAGTLALGFVCYRRKRK